jgi:hypothetical protein
MKNSHSQRNCKGKTMFLKHSLGSLRHVAGKKKATSIACLTILGIMLCAILPEAVYPSGSQFGITTTCSTSYPTATFGNTGSGGNLGGLADILIATKYTLSVSGTVNKIGGFAALSGHWKLGIYSDSGGSPGTLLAANNVANPVSAGDNSFDIGPVYLTAGTYWIAILTDPGNRKYDLGT